MRHCDKPPIRTYPSGVTLSAVLRDEASGYPTEGEVTLKQELFACIRRERGLEFPGGIQYQAPTDQTPGGLTVGLPPTDVKKAVFRNAITVQMLEGYGDIMGKRLPSDIKDAILGISTDMFADRTAALADTVISGWLNTGSEMMTSALASSSVNKRFDRAALELGTITIEAITSGKPMDDAQILNFAMSSGASAGAMIGSIFPGIGTAIGSAIGAAIGATIGKIIGAFTKPAWKLAEREAQERAEKAANALRLQCNNADSALQQGIMEEIYSISTRWINIERTLGYRIPLRWFDPNPGLRFESAAQQGRPYLNKLITWGGTYRSRAGPPVAELNNTLTPKRPGYDGYPYPYGKFKCFTSAKSRQAEGPYLGKQHRVEGQEVKGMCNFYCPEKTLGCLYPSPSEGAFRSYGPVRVMSALYARGFDLPVSLRCSEMKLATDVYKKENYKNYNNRGEKGEEAMAKYNEDIDKYIRMGSKGLQASLNKISEDFKTTAAIISSDLTRTTAVMKAKQTILMNEIALAGQGIIELQEAAEVGKADKEEEERPLAQIISAIWPSAAVSETGIKSDTKINPGALRASSIHPVRMRNIALIGGVSIAAIAVWRASRRER